MQDLRAAPRWSKTAGIVVLVVFGLVLLVAIFGLWALTAQFDEDRKERLIQAGAQGGTALGEIQQSFDAKLGGVIRRAQKLHAGLDDDRWSYRQDASAALRAYLEGEGHGDLASWVLLVDGNRSLRWVGGRHRMWVRDDLLRAAAARQDATEGAAIVRGEEAKETRRREGATAALVKYAELTRDAGLAAWPPGTDPEGAPFPFGLGWTVEMVKTAAAALNEDATSVKPAVVRDVLLLAEEMRALNRQLSRVDARRLADYEKDIDHETRRVFQHVPADLRDALMWEVAEFRRVAALVGPADANELRAELWAVRSGMAEDYGERRVAVMPQGKRIFGLFTVSGVRALVVSLDPTGVEQLLREAVDEQAATFERLGQMPMIFPDDQKPVGPNKMAPAAGRELNGDFAVPYRLALFQTGQPAGDEDKYTSWLFWAVIALAGAGLCVGGYVLVRLLTREVRLAQLKADFVSNLSHELKTPITSISLFTEMLEDGKLTEPEDQEEAFAVIGQEIRRLRRIVMRMIDVARGEARTTPYNLSTGDLNEPVEEAAARFERIVTEPGLTLTVQLHPEPLPVEMDVQALDDVVTNLLSNAWKYKRGDEARIVLRTARRGRLAEIVVQDDGVGIPRAERRKVFDMFYRSEQYLTHPVAGTGLGLALVRSVVMGHKGRIDVDGGPGGVGSVFTVRLPLARSASTAPAGGETPASPSSDAPPHGKVVPS